MHIKFYSGISWAAQLIDEKGGKIVDVSDITGI